MGTVRGTVTLDGKPLAGVIVEFTPLERHGAPSYGRTDEDGYYELRFSVTRDGAFLGKQRVRFRIDQSYDEGGNPRPAKLTLPARYTSKSELTFNVEDGRNRADFALESGRT
jgi:hypothetical protein